MLGLCGLQGRFMHLPDHNNGFRVVRPVQVRVFPESWVNGVGWVQEWWGSWLASWTPPPPESGSHDSISPELGYVSWVGMIHWDHMEHLGIFQFHKVPVNHPHATHTTQLRTYIVLTA